MITLITGNHPRHFYFVKCISDKFTIDNWIIQKREDFKTNSYENYKDLSKLEKLHFAKREEAEHKFFSQYSKINKKNIKNMMEIERDEFKNGNLKKRLKDFKNLNLITYGCEILNDDVLNTFSLNKLNVHGGLSPWYRGSITHFWPSYLLEPEFTGMTLHEITQNVDGGNIIHQSVVNLKSTDNLHENACRCVSDFLKELPFLSNAKIFEKKIAGVKQSTTGRIWTSKMWHPNLLKIVYEFFEDKINKFCIENKKLRKPIIKSVLSSKQKRD